MKTKRILALIVCLLVILGTLCACDKKIYLTTGLKDSELFKISGKAYPLSEAMLVLVNEKNQYEKDFGYDVWSGKFDKGDVKLENEIKDKVKLRMSELKTIELMANEKKIILNDNEKSALSNAAEEYYNSLTENEIKLIGISKEDVLSLYTSFYMADRVYDKLTCDVKVEVSDEQARVIQYMYIKLPYYELSEGGQKIYFDEEKEEEIDKKAVIIKELIDGGNDFMTVAGKYTECEVKSGNLARGEVEPVVEKEAFLLKSGEVSNLIKTDEGYYILLCVSDYLQTETEVNKKKVIENAKKNEYDKAYKNYKSEKRFEFNDNIWEKIHLEDYTEVKTISLYEIYNKWIATIE